MRFTSVRQTEIQCFPLHLAPAIELYSGDSAIKVIPKRECAIKFRISARDVAEQIYYVAASVNDSGGREDVSLERRSGY